MIKQASNVQFDFSNQHVLVTGGSRGIGYGIASAFYASGAEVTILAESKLVHTAAKQLAKESGRPVQSLQCDISDAKAVATAIEPLETIDILVNNAGLERITPVKDTEQQTINEFERIIDINVKGTYHVTRHVIPKMPVGSCMIMTCSIWSFTAVAEFSAYCSSKHANLGFMRSMAAELAPRQIRVNAVCPGWVKTEAAMLSLKNMSQRSGRDEQELLDEITGNQLLNGLMQPDDIAPSYLFLASNAASNITGQAIVVDRGELC